MLNQIKSFSSLVKFGHTLFAMPFALVGFFTATNKHGYDFDWILLLKVILCMVFARNAAMGFNRFADRLIDAKNVRTSLREIPKGIISPNAVLVFVLLNALLFILTTFFINRLTFFLSPVALFVVLFYSLTKKITVLCHIVLGIGLSLAPIGAYLSVTGEFSWLPLMFSFLVLFWVAGFDIIYALQDIEFDSKEKLKSIPVVLGIRGALYLSSLLHFLCVNILIFTGFYFGYGFFYWFGSFVFVVLLVFQHSLLKPTDLSKLNLAFFTLNGIASVLFSVFYVIDVIVK